MNKSENKIIKNKNKNSNKNRNNIDQIVYHYQRGYADGYKRSISHNLTQHNIIYVTINNFLSIMCVFIIIILLIMYYDYKI